MKISEIISESKEFRTKKNPDGFTIDLIVDGKHVGQYTHAREDDIVRNQAEIFPEYRAKGYGTMLLLAAIKTANDLGLDFEEDTQSLTPAMSRIYDELDDSGMIYGGRGAWAISPGGESELEDFLNEGLRAWFGKGKKSTLDEMPAMTLHGPDGFGLTQYSGDEYALVGGFRDGASNAGELRLKYQIYSHALIAANGGNFEKGEIGYCVVRVASDDGPDQGEILGLIDIELKPKYRKSGHGKKIVRDIVDTTKSGNLDIHDIQKKAKKFWDKMGVEYDAKKPGAKNAVLRKQTEQIEEDLRAWFGKGKKANRDRLASYTNEEKTRLDPKCWDDKKIGKPATKMKNGVRVNNCVPKK